MTMTRPKNHRAGFSLIEALGAITLLGLVLTAAVAAFSFVLRSDLRIATKSEMDLDSRLLVERLRQDLWRTSREMILLHPEGDGPYEAISFPVVLREDGGSVPLVADEAVDWTATVIYHMRAETPSQVLRTEFRPRDNSLTRQERRSQLAAVVQDGHGQGTFNGANASTRELISNLVEWELDITPARFDTYAPEIGRQRFRLGSVLLNDGANQITFETAGKRANTGSSRHLGVDTLTLTASGLEREAEWMTVHSSSGSVPAIQNMGTGETWSGNSQLSFPSTTDGNAFTLRFENDLWEERNFFSTGMKIEDVQRTFVQPNDTPHTFVLRLEGNDIVWTAADQTRTTPDQMDSPVYTYQTSYYEV
jgi:type II secretory pathway component PulJ